MSQHANPHSHTVPSSNAFCLSYNYKMLKVQLHIFFNTETFVKKLAQSTKKKTPPTFKMYKIIGKFQIPTQQFYTLVVLIFFLHF